MVQPSFLPISIGFLILILVIVITSTVLFAKKKKLSARKSIGLGFLIFTGLGAVIFAIVMGVNGLKSWYDTQKTNYRVYGTVYEWGDAPANVNLQVYINPTEDITKGKTLTPVQGIPLSFQKSPFANDGDVFHVVSSTNGTFDSGIISIQRGSFPTLFNYTVNGETYAYIPVNTVFKNGSNIIILMKK